MVAAVPLLDHFKPCAARRGRATHERGHAGGAAGRLPHGDGGQPVGQGGQPVGQGGGDWPRWLHHDQGQVPFLLALLQLLHRAQRAVWGCHTQHQLRGCRAHWGRDDLRGGGQPPHGRAHSNDSDEYDEDDEYDEEEATRQATTISSKESPRRRRRDSSNSSRPRCHSVDIRGKSKLRLLGLLLGMLLGMLAKTSGQAGSKRS